MSLLSLLVVLFGLLPLGFPFGIRRVGLGYTPSENLAQPVDTTGHSDFAALYSEVVDQSTAFYSTKHRDEAGAILPFHGKVMYATRAEPRTAVYSEVIEKAEAKPGRALSDVRTVNPFIHQINQEDPSDQFKVKLNEETSENPFKINIPLIHRRNDSSSTCYFIEQVLYRLI